MFEPDGSVAAAAANWTKMEFIRSITSQKYCWHSGLERQQFAKSKTGLLSEFHRQTDGELVIVFPGAALGLDFIVARLRKRHRKLLVASVALATGAVPASNFEFSIRGSAFVD